MTESKVILMCANCRHQEQAHLNKGNCLISECDCDSWESPLPADQEKAILETINALPGNTASVIDVTEDLKDKKQKQEVYRATSNNTARLEEFVKTITGIARAQFKGKKPEDLPDSTYQDSVLGEAALAVARLADTVEYFTQGAGLDKNKATPFEQAFGFMSNLLSRDIIMIMKHISVEEDPKKKGAWIFVPRLCSSPTCSFKKRAEDRVKSEAMAEAMQEAEKEKVH